MFRSLHVRNYRLYASANLVSLTGTWMQRIGQDWLVLQLAPTAASRSASITALQFGPSLLLGLCGGVLADRYDKRRLLMITQALMGLLALLLGILVVTGAVALWHVFVLAAALGAVAAIDAPVRQSFVSEMVGPELLANAVEPQLHDLQRRPPGRARARRPDHRRGSDTAPAFLVNAASFAFTIGALAGMRAARAAAQPAASPRAAGQLREGLRYTWAHPDLVLAMALVFVIGTFGFNYQVTIALMAREVFHLGAEAFGLLSTAFAVGSLTGALLSTRRSVRPRQRFLVISSVVFGAADRRLRLHADATCPSPCCWCPPAPRPWCSAWPTTASSSSASTRRCAAGSWRCTSCASWAARRSARRSSAGSPSTSAPRGG